MNLSERPDRVVDILEDCGSLDLGSNPSRGANLFENHDCKSG